MELFAKGGTGIHRLFLGPKALYVRSEYDLVRYDKATRKSRYLARTGYRACAVALHGGTLYWSEVGRGLSDRGGQIRKLDVRNLQPRNPNADWPKGTQVVRGLKFPQALVADSRGLLWLDTKLRRVTAWHRGRQRTLGRVGRGMDYLLLCTRRLAADATHVYYVDARRGRPPTAASDRVMRVSRRGGRPQVLADRQRMPTRVLVDATHVYWTTEALPRGGAAAVRRVAKTGGRVETLVTTQDNPSSLRLQGGWLYWLERAFQAGYRIRRVRVTGGPVQTLFSSPMRTSSLDVDATHLYWTDQGHPHGTCHTIYGCSRNPFRRRVCSGPWLRILRMRIPR